MRSNSLPLRMEVYGEDAGIIGALPEDLFVSVEIPSHRRIAETGHAAWAKTCLDASRKAMECIDKAR